MPDDDATGAETLFVGFSELALRMREVDWRSLGVGSPDGWPQSVRAIIRMMLTSRYAMWMGWGPELTFFYNDAYAGMTLGAKHPWALGKRADQVWAEIWPDIGPRIHHVLETGEATWDEGLLLFLERSGFPEETYHTFSYSPVHDDNGRIAGMFCVVTEDTTRVIGERRLGLLREFGARLASSQTTEDVWAAVEGSLAGDARDLPFVLTYAIGERQSRATLAASCNMPPGHPAAQRALPVDDAVWPIRRFVEGTTTTPTVVDLLDDLPWPSGPWRKPPVRAIVVPIPQPAKTRPAGVFIAGLNPFRPFDADYESFITLYVGQLASGLANAQAYVAERRRAEALAQIDRAKTTFFSNVSHELRTPLTLILGPVTDALTGPARALTGESLDLVYRNGLRLRRLVNGLLDFSRIEAGRSEASFEPVDLGAYTADLASVFRSAIERAGLRFVIDCPSEAGVAFVDREMWEKVVLNLISNAFKFTFDGEIGVAVHRDGDRFLVSIRDTGAGIAPEELPRIFDRFHRVEGSTGRTQEGTGIGLALVQELVKLHGGTIAAESAPGQGTTFTVSLPIGSDHLPSDRVQARRTAASTSVGAHVFVEEALRWLPGEEGSEQTPLDLGVRDASVSPGPSLDSGRIVLADDNADMRAYVTSLLASRWLVHVAADGEEALALVREVQPDLVITDVMMPRLDGFGLLRQLRTDARTWHIPVMMLSARAGEESRLEGFQAGADDYLVKPFTARELMSRVEAQFLRARIRALEEQATRRLAAVLARAPVPIAIVRGADYTVEIANDAALALVDRPLVGRRLAEAIPELEEQGLLTLFDRVFASGEPYIGRPLQVTLRDAGGAPHIRFFDVALQPLVDGNGAVEGVAVVAYDVTGLASARRAAEAANRAKDEFLAMLGHELRNPLAPILTALQLLRLRGIDTGERERTIIERQVRHLAGLVDDLLDVSRITRGKIRLNKQPIEMSEVVAKAIEIASPLLEQYRHDLQTDVPRRGLEVMGDAVRLAQVVSNLLTNAAKYTPPGGAIAVSARREGDEVALSVRDTGIGIEPEMLPRVFDLFTQDRQAIDRAQGGLGLGLAIVRSFVALHGGSVSALSAGRGHGTEFVIRLPKLEAAVLPAPRAGPRAEGAATGSGCRVLIVDDNEDAALMLAEALAADGHDTRTAFDGPTALDLAKTFRPEVALLDIGLPVMDGFELARLLNGTPGESRIRLVAVTGYGQEHDRLRSESAGFDAHLVKPVDIDRLSRLVRELTERTGKNV